ncbi:hypothetical protein FB451DRAFT_15797 [Mycena latifolia]|nr:hypothetical protein FB451DRAFT_15797 [Mycena latifolia]
MDINKFLAPHSAEARAHHVTYAYRTQSIHLLTKKNPKKQRKRYRLGCHWPDHRRNRLAHCASYRSFQRYLSGEYLIILPRTPRELESILRRYSTDAIHNAIAKSRSTLETGGYSRVCHLAAKSIQEVLNTGDNMAYLLALHAPTDTSPREGEGPTRSMATT